MDKNECSSSQVSSESSCNGGPNLKSDFSSTRLLVHHRINLSHFPVWCVYFFLQKRDLLPKMLTKKLIWKADGNMKRSCESCALGWWWWVERKLITLFPLLSFFNMTTSYVNGNYICNAAYTRYSLIRTSSLCPMYFPNLFLNMFSTVIKIHIEFGPSQST